MEIKVCRDRKDRRDYKNEIIENSSTFAHIGPKDHLLPQRLPPPRIPLMLAALKTVGALRCGASGEQRDSPRSSFCGSVDC